MTLSPGTLEEALEQEKLGIQILLLWVSINDGNGLQRAVAPAEFPLGAKHLDNIFFQEGGPAVATASCSLSRQQARCARAMTALSMAPPAFVLISMSPMASC